MKLLKRYCRRILVNNDTNYRSREMNPFAAESYTLYKIQILRGLIKYC